MMFLACSLALAATTPNLDLNHLSGLDPQVYLARRRPEPEVSSELRQAARTQAAALIEMYLKGQNSYAWADDGRYPRELDAMRRADLRRAERAALREGLLVAIADSGHRDAPALLSRAVQQESGRARLVAIKALGLTGAETAVAPLARLAEDQNVATEVRMAALVGLGHVRESLALRTLLKVDDLALVPTALRATAAWASPSAWAAIGKSCGTDCDAAARAGVAWAPHARSDIRAAALDLLSVLASPSVKTLIQEQLKGNLPAEEVARLVAAKQRVLMALGR